ncbi:MAG: hypothetical protein QM820_23315 [Minicystis sp.]
MNPSFELVLPVIAGAAAFLFVVSVLDGRLTGLARVYFRYVAAAASVGLFFVGLGRLVPQHQRASDIAKAAIAIVAVGAIFYEQHRNNLRRPVSERWKRFIGIVLALSAIVAYYRGFKFGYPKYYHRHDQYHYYLGAKYFPELGYDGLYRCTIVAQDELGVVEFNDDAGNRRRLDFKQEARRPDKKIRNLGGDNLLKPGSDFLEQPEVCTSHFAPERWAAFKEDIKFFRLSADCDTFDGMQKDHGYNPPPVWMLAGSFFANMHPAGYKSFGYVWLQYLAMIDVVLIAGMFAALWWAFGWRVFAIAAVFWGCNAPGDSYFVEGAFLRMDWLFFFVLTACLARKRYFALAGASLVYAGLLRIFPGLVVVGGLVVAGAYLVRHKTLAKDHRRMLLGGVLAAAVLIPASVKLCGRDAYRDFYRHTLEVHDRTPLTNHMGLRVLVAHKIGTGPSSGRAMYVSDNKALDPFEVWKKLRNERYDKYRGVAYAIIALSLAFFVWVGRRVKTMWIALCLGQIFIILMSQLTSYYYAFLVITAPLTRVKRQIEVPFLGLAALSQFMWLTIGWFDDKSAAVTLVSLAFCYWLVCLFAPAGTFARLMGRGPKADDAG